MKAKIKLCEASEDHRLPLPRSQSWHANPNPQKLLLAQGGKDLHPVGVDFSKIAGCPRRVSLRISDHDVKSRGLLLEETATSNKGSNHGWQAPICARVLTSFWHGLQDIHLWAS